MTLVTQSGYGNDGAWNGTDINSTTTVPTLSFNNPRALDFNGSDDYVDAGNDSSLNVSNITMSFVGTSSPIRY